MREECSDPLKADRPALRVNPANYVRWVRLDASRLHRRGRDGVLSVRDGEFDFVARGEGA